MKNLYEENPDKMLKLISKICQDKQNSTKASRLSDELLRFIETDFMEFLKTDTPENITSLLFDFKYEFERFREFTSFPDFSERNVVGLGGRFSSGKSSFLNSLAGEKILPSGTTKTTSIPTLIGKGREKILVLNRFDNLAKIDKQALQVLKHYIHGDGQEYSYSHILKQIFVKTEKILYENLVFLDTPGYSSAETEIYIENTDEKIARAQLNNSNYILWFIDAENGTITREDINFLKTINKNIPILVIVSKADKKKNEINEIVQHIKNKPELKELNILDVVPYSARKKKLFPIKSITYYFEQWNKEKIHVLFAKNFKRFFVSLSDYFTLMEDEKKQELSRLNRALALSENDFVKNELSGLIQKSKIIIEKFKSKQKELEDLKIHFFSKIKEIADLTGIQMPEPSELDLIEDDVDFEDVLDKFIKDNRLKPHKKALKSFAGIKPKFKFFDGDTKSFEKYLIDGSLIKFLNDFNYFTLKSFAGIKPKFKFFDDDTKCFEKYLIDGSLINFLNDFNYFNILQNFKHTGY